MDKGNDNKPDQGRDEEADPEKHDRFNHNERLPTHPGLVPEREYYPNPGP